MWTAERMWGAGSRNGMTTNGFVARNERAAQRGRNHRRYRVTAGPEANGGQWPSTKIKCDLVPLLGKALRCRWPEKRKS